MPVEYFPSLPPDTATPQGVAEWTRKELELLGQKLGALDVLRLEISTPPASAGAPGTKGTILIGSDGYIYVCLATDTWLKVEVVTWT